MTDGGDAGAASGAGGERGGGSGSPEGGGEAGSGSAARRPAQAQERDGPVGDPGAASRRRRSGREERGPTRIGGLVGALFEKLGIADRVERAAAAERWDDVVGPEIARRTGDVRVSGRTLFVEVESSSWMQELEMRRHHILRKLNEELEEAEIEKIVFVQEGGRRGSRDGGR